MRPKARVREALKFPLIGSRKGEIGQRGGARGSEGGAAGRRGNPLPRDAAGNCGILRRLHISNSTCSPGRPDTSPLAGVCLLGGTAPLARAKGSGKGRYEAAPAPGRLCDCATASPHRPGAPRNSPGAPVPRCKSEPVSPRWLRDGGAPRSEPGDRIARSGETAHLALRRAAALAARGCHTWRAPTEPRCPRTPDSASCPPRTPKGLPLGHDPSQPRCPAPAATVVTPGGKRTGCLSRAKGTPKVDPDRGRPITPSTRLQREHPPPRLTF